MVHNSLPMAVVVPQAVTANPHGRRGSRMAGVTTTQNVIQGGQGGPTLLEQDGTFSVTNGEGEVLYQGNEVGAEFKYWRTVLEVPDDDDSGVVL